MKLKKVMLMSIMASVVAVFASGCSPAESGTTTASGDSSSQSVEDTTTGEKQKLTVSVWDNDASPQFKVISEAFMERFPDVEIELIDTQADEYQNKVTVMLAGGDSDPDVIFIKDTENQVTMQEKGQILNLDEYIAKDNVDLAPYNGIGELLQIDGSSYSLPYRKDWYVLYYNKDLFDQQNVEYPSDDMTWDEFEELAARMTFGEGGSKVYGSHNHTWMAMVSNWAVQDGENDLMASDYSFLKPYYEQALRLQDEGIVQSYANLKTGSIHYVSVFEQEQCAMIPMGSWFITTLINDQKAGSFDFDWGVVRIPHPEGVEAGNTVGSTTPVAINAKSDNPDMAWEFVKFITGEEGAMILAENGIFPAYESDLVAEKLAAMDGYPEDSENALTSTGFVFDRPIDLNMASVRKVIEEEHDLIMIGEQSIDEGIENMNERAKEAIDNK